MERLKTAYKNMPLKQSLIFTILVSLIISFLLGTFFLIITRPSYYTLVSTTKEFSILFLHNTISLLLICISSIIPIIVGIYIFYKYKLSIPINLLMKGTEEISLYNLNFEIKYQSNDEFGTLCNSFDTMRKELQKNYKNIWSMTEERKKLNAAFAHNLRTPLTVLKGYTDFLEEYIPSPKKSDEKLLSTNHMMAKYIQRLEDYVSIMNNIQKLENTPVNINAILVDEFIEMLTNNIKLISKQYNKSFSIYHKFNSLSINCDISLVFRSLDNISKNAFQYAKNKVIINLYEDNNFLYIEIIDDGPGFTDNDLKNALNPFYSSNKLESCHFGIGLNICKILSKNHGGSISLSNEKNLGAKVKISFSIKSR